MQRKNTLIKFTMQFDFVDSVAQTTTLWRAVHNSRTPIALVINSNLVRGKYN